MEFDLDRQNALNWVSFYYGLAKAMQDRIRLPVAFKHLKDIGFSSSSGRQKALRRGVEYGIIKKYPYTNTRFAMCELTSYGRELLEEIENERMGES